MYNITRNIENVLKVSDIDTYRHNNYCEVCLLHPFYAMDT